VNNSVNQSPPGPPSAGVRPYSTAGGRVLGSTQPAPLLVLARFQAKNQLTKNKSHRVTPFWHNDTRSRVTVTFGARRGGAYLGTAARSARGHSCPQQCSMGRMTWELVGAPCFGACPIQSTSNAEKPALRKCSSVVSACEISRSFITQKLRQSTKDRREDLTGHRPQRLFGRWSAGRAARLIREDETPGRPGIFPP